MRVSTVHREANRHDYTFTVDLVNKGSVQITDWRVRVEFPAEFVKRATGVYQDESGSYSQSSARLYPGDRRPAVINLPYHVDDANYDLIQPDRPFVVLH